MRARYFRGHGVHSPFVYDLVRHVFMRAELLPGDRSLYEALLAVGIAESSGCAVAEFSHPVAVTVLLA